MEAFCQYAVAASKEALEDAGIDMEKEDPYRVGCSIGSGVERKHNGGNLVCRLVERRVAYEWATHKVVIDLPPATQLMKRLLGRGYTY